MKKTIFYLSSILVRDCEDSNNSVTILSDEIVDIFGKDGLSNYSYLQTSCHDGRC